MENRIILSLLRTIGIHNPTSEDFQRVCEIVRVDKLNKKTKFALWLLLPTLNQYVEYLLTPDKPVGEDIE